MSAPRRASPRQTLGSILSAPDYETALARLTAALHRTWAAGSSAGWSDGVSDAMDDNPKVTPNPYPTGK